MRHTHVKLTYAARDEGVRQPLARVVAREDAGGLRTRLPWQHVAGVTEQVRATRARHEETVARLVESAARLG